MLTFYLIYSPAITGKIYIYMYTVRKCSTARPTELGSLQHLSEPFSIPMHKPYFGAQIGPDWD